MVHIGKFRLELVKLFDIVENSSLCKAITIVRRVVIAQLTVVSTFFMAALVWTSNH